MNNCLVMVRVVNQQVKEKKEEKNVRFNGVKCPLLYLKRAFNVTFYDLIKNINSCH